MSEENKVTKEQQRPPIIEMALSDMKPAPYNPRIELFPGDKDFESLKKSLETFGFVEPIVVNSRTDHIIGGHQRHRVAEEMGLKSAPVVLLDLSDAEERALNIALNKISGEFDNAKLKDILLELEIADIDETLTGFADYEIDELIRSFEEDSDDVEFEEAEIPDIVDVKAKIGDYRFFIPGREYAEWIDGIMREVGSDEHLIKKEIRRRLGLKENE